MSGKNGSHTPDHEQQAKLEQMFGLRYQHVSTSPYGIGMNRAVRRKLRKAKR